MQWSIEKEQASCFFDPLQLEGHSCTILDLVKLDNILHVESALRALSSCTCKYVYLYTAIYIALAVLADDIHGAQFMISGTSHPIHIKC